MLLRFVLVVVGRPLVDGGSEVVIGASLSAFSSRLIYMGAVVSIVAAKGGIGASKGK